MSKLANTSAVSCPAMDPICLQQKPATAEDIHSVAYSSAKVITLRVQGTVVKSINKQTGPVTSKYV